MNEIECETCIKRKTKYCPNSSECYNTTNKPYYQNRIMLLEENLKLKEQYCERTDCSGRLGNSKKVEELEQENQQLKENNLAMQEEMARTWAKLQQKEDIINKAKDIIKELAYGGNEDYYMEEFKKVLEILDNKGE